MIEPLTDLDIGEGRVKVMAALSNAEPDIPRQFLRITRAACYGQNYLRLAQGNWLDRLALKFAAWRMSKRDWIEN